MAAVAAPAGSGKLATLTGCVVCQKVPVTATLPPMLTAPLLTVTDHGAPPWFAVTVPDTGCVACQNVPVTAWLALLSCRATFRLPLPVRAAGSPPARSLNSPDSQPRIPLPPVGGVMPVPSVPSWAAPVGRGRDEAEIGCVTPEPSTFHAELPGVPWFAVTVPDTGWTDCQKTPLTGTAL